MKEDLQHLKLLSIFYYVVGGLIALVSCFPIIHFLIGLMLIVSPPPANANQGPGPEVVGWIFVLGAGAFILLGWTCAILTLFAGWFLPQCKHYVYCLVVAGIVCLFAPKGTILGVFTFIVLLRPSVKRLFETGGVVDEPEEGRTGRNARATDPAEDEDERVWRKVPDLRLRAYQDD